MLRRPRHRRLTVWLAVFALLFQQLAMAAYVCAKEAPAVSSVAAPECHEDVETDLARCHEHCNPTNAVAEHAAPLTVPAALIGAADLPVPKPLHAAHGFRHAPRHPWATAPPLNLRFCSLQI